MLIYSSCYAQACIIVAASLSLQLLCLMQMDNVTKELKTNNMKLKGLVESVSGGLSCCHSTCCRQQY